LSCVERDAPASRGGPAGARQRAGRISTSGWASARRIGKEAPARQPTCVPEPGIRRGDLNSRARISNDGPPLEPLVQAVSPVTLGRAIEVSAKEMDAVQPLDSFLKPRAMQTLCSRDLPLSVVAPIHPPRLGCRPARLVAHQPTVPVSVRTNAASS